MDIEILSHVKYIEEAVTVSQVTVVVAWGTLSVVIVSMSELGLEPTEFVANIRYR